MIDPLGAVDRSIALVKRLREISKNVAEAEARNLLADLSNELADAKLEIADLKEQLAVQIDANCKLKAASPVARPKPSGIKWGCYQFVGEEGLYCTACYDSRGAKSLTNRTNSNCRSCPVCRAVIGS